MFIENKEYEPFALEFKRCYKELITKLSEIWNEYDAEGNKIHYKNSDGNEEWYEYAL